MASPDPAPPDPSSDVEDDEALRAAIALSLQEQRQNSPSTAANPSARQDPRQTETSFSLLSLNRKKMEEDRLARMARKRARSPSDDQVVEVPPPKKKGPKSARRYMHRFYVTISRRRGEADLGPWLSADRRRHQD